jgi:uncharacterized damage-inducible protein DinB
VAQHGRQDRAGSGSALTSRYEVTIMASQSCSKPVCSELLRYKKWADDGLYRVVRENLDRINEFDRGVVLQLLDHMHAVDSIFRHHLLGERHGYESARSREPMPFEVLAEKARALDDWYVDHARSLSEDQLDETVDFVFTSGAPARMRRGDMILHVALHGTYHRGGAGILLQKNGVTPNDDRLTDFLGAEP